MIIPKSFEQIGDIVIFSEFPKVSKKEEKNIAKELLKKNKHIKVVAKKIKNFSGRYRLQKLKVLAGENRKETIHKENGVRIKINPEKAYFSSKTGSERARISNLVKNNEVVLVMFSGVGPYCINISKHSKAKEIHGIESNPSAHEYAKENKLLNKTRNIFFHKGTVNLILPKLKMKFDRIVMPAPKTASKYIKLAKKYLKKNGTIHIYTFEKEINFDKLIKKF